MQLTISHGRLDLPVYQAESEQGWKPTTKIVLANEVTRTLRDGLEHKALVCHGGKDHLTIEADHGTTEFVEHGLRIRSALKEDWCIDHSDVTKASADITWSRSMARDDFEASTEVKMHMHCDEKTYYITAELVANDGEDCIFTRQFEERIDRP